MVIKNIGKKILRPFVKTAKKILRPITKRIRAWYIGLIREAILNELIQHIHILHQESRNFSNTILDKVNRIEQKTTRSLDYSFDHYPFVNNYISKVNQSNQVIPGITTSLPFGLFIRPDLMLVKHPIVEYYYASSIDFTRLSLLLFQSYQQNLAHYLNRYPKSNSIFLDLDPIDGYHTLSIASNLDEKSQILVPGNPTLQTNINFCSYNQNIHYLCNNSSRRDLIQEAYSKSEVNLILLNNYSKVVEDFQWILQSVRSFFPDIVFEYSREINNAISPVVSNILSQYPDLGLFILNKSGQLDKIQDWDSLTEVCHLVLTHQEKN